MLKRNIAVFLSVIMLLTILLSGCGKTSTSSSDKTSNKAVSSNVKKNNAPVKLKNKEKAIAYAFGSWPKPPLYQGNPFAAGGVGSAYDWVYCGLFQWWRSTGNFKPFIAESYEQKGLQTIIHLRKDVKWNDGQPFTSKDVWAYYILNNGTYVTKFLKSIDTPDDYTVVFNWDKFSPPDDLKIKYIAHDVQDTIPYHIYGKYVDKAKEILDKAQPTDDLSKRGPFGKYIDKDTSDALNKNWQDFTKENPKLPIGTGPFMVQKVTASEMILVKNPYFFWKDNVKFDKVHLYIADQPGALAMFRSGKTNLAGGWETGGTKDIIENLLQTNKDLVFYPAGDPAAFGTSFNIQKAPFDDVNVRKAVLYAVDRSKIRDVANPYATLVDYAATALLPIPQFMDPWVSKDIQDKLTKYKYDPAKAEEMLKASGWTKGSDGIWRDKNGKMYNLTIACQSGWPVKGMEVQAEEMTKFGLPTKLTVQDPSIYYTNATRPKAMYNMAWDFMFNWTNDGINDPPTIFNNFFNGFPGQAGNFPTFKSGPDQGRTNMIFKGPDGKDVNINDVLKKMPYMSEDELKKVSGDLVWIINENALAFTWFWNTGTTMVNAGQIGGVPMEDQLAKYNRNMPMPATDKDYDDVMAFWMPGILKYYIATGQVYPK
ncbi:ABC transporter substrate-binding protein [Caldanaerobius fijiensis]|uniref:ABC transporter substrate-binding protein n=1 Tax=Caldanaerobius fijiensis TaxID=456330 RepID=UPI000934503B|nr:ABC transporter substrate-binding protein [Caldanaerobius fijiensis]